MRNTQNYDEFGHVEREEATLLLKTYGTNKDDTIRLESGIKVEFNPMSGNVFLVDEDFNCAMMNGDRLENFFYCHECGNEALQSEFREQCESDCCIEYANELGIEK